MIHKSAFSEEIEELLDKIDDLEDNIATLRSVNKGITQTLNVTLVMFQSMQDMMIEKGVITKEELHKKTEHLKKVYEKEMKKERESMEQLSEHEYQQWLLNSGSYGNA